MGNKGKWRPIAYMTLTGHKTKVIDKTMTATAHILKVRMIVDGELRCECYAFERRSKRKATDVFLLNLHNEAGLTRHDGKKPEAIEIWSPISGAPLGKNSFGHQIDK